MNAASPPDTGIVLTTSPPEACAGQQTTLKFDLRLHHQPVTKLTLALPMGTGDASLVTRADADFIQPVLGTDYHFTPSTPVTSTTPFKPSSNEPYWTIGRPEKTADSLIYTLTAHHTETHTTDHLHVEFIGVRFNLAPGRAIITLNAYKGTTPTATTTTLTKRAPGLKIENFRATGRYTTDTKTIAGKSTPITKVRNGKPIHLTWTAQDVKMLTLKRGDKSENLQPDQRSYPDPLDHNAKPLILTDDTKFTLTAAKGEEAATQDLYLTVSQPDGTYTDLTVTGGFSLPVTPAPTTHQYWLTNDIKFEAKTDGYYQVSLFLYSRFYGCFPPSKDMDRCIPASVEIGGATFLCNNLESSPLTVFAPAGTVLTVKKPERDPSTFFFSYFPATNVTWIGSAPEKSLPQVSPQKIYEAFPAKGRAPICAAENTTGHINSLSELIWSSKGKCYQNHIGVEVYRETTNLKEVKRKGIVWKTAPHAAKAVTETIWTQHEAKNDRKEYEFSMEDEITAMEVRAKPFKLPSASDPVDARHAPAPADFTITHDPIPRIENLDTARQEDLHYFYRLRWNRRSFSTKSSPQQPDEFNDIHVSTSKKSEARITKAAICENIESVGNDRNVGVSWNADNITVLFAGENSAAYTKKTIQLDIEHNVKTSAGDNSVGLPDAASDFTIPGTSVRVSVNSECDKDKPIKVIEGWKITSEGLYEGGELRTPPDGYRRGSAQ
ncbi:hypothetical protein [Streptomyces sp. NPDC059003]|uniref:hypothetical protein n=1 Tax=Streptomyces sp. NPDC059003 TaxID=3346691 RepID=UPI0036BA7332